MSDETANQDAPAEDDFVTVEEMSADNAILLLDAAQALDLEPDVVRTTSDGFVVPKDVYAKSGLGKKKAPAKAADKSKETS